MIVKGVFDVVDTVFLYVQYHGEGWMEYLSSVGPGGKTEFPKRITVKKGLLNWRHTPKSVLLRGQYCILNLGHLFKFI